MSLALGRRTQLAGMALVATELSWEQAMRLDSRNDDGKAGGLRERTQVGRNGAGRVLLIFQGTIT